MSSSTRLGKAVAAAALFGAATVAAPAAHAADAPSVTITLDASVEGKTVDVAYQDSGVQYFVNDGRKAMSRYGAMAFFVDYGDGSERDGYDGRPGLTCETTGPTSPFHDSVSSGYTHTYRKAGTYTITATGYYCGSGGLQKVKETTTVEIAKPSPKVSASANIDYTVDGLTATLMPYVTGTQHEMKYGHNKHAKYGVPLSYTMSFPKGAKVSGGATKGGIKKAKCTNNGSVEFDPVALSGDPVVVKFPKPGTYEVTLDADVCTDSRHVSKTVTIVVPEGSTPEPTTPAPTTPAPTTPVPTSPGSTTPAPTTPVPTTSTSHPTTPTVQPTAPTTSSTSTSTTTSTTTGPKVETDQLGGGSNTLVLGPAGLTGVGALGGVLVARRRMQ